VSLLGLFAGRRQLIVYRAFSSRCARLGPITVPRLFQIGDKSQPRPSERPPTQLVFATPTRRRTSSA